MSNAHQQFKDARPKDCDWALWMNGWSLYDGGLCVNRSIDEHTETDKHPRVRLEYFTKDYIPKIRKIYD